MSGHQMRSAIQRAAQMAAYGQNGRNRDGLVTSYDPSTYSVKVALQPDGTETSDPIALGRPRLGHVLPAADRRVGAGDH